MLVGTLVALGFLWLLVLTLLLAGVVSQLGVVKAAGATGGPGGFLFDADGPSVPSQAPESALGSLLENGVKVDDLMLTFFSSRCGSCVERATEIVAALSGPANVFLVTGNSQDAVGGMLDILGPTGYPVLTDPIASNIVKALDIHSTPFTLRIVDGQVVGKAYLRELADYRSLAALPSDGLAARDVASSVN